MINMVVAICDDESIFREKIKQMLLDYKIQRRMHLDIVEFDNGTSLLNYDSAFDIVFLDYQMPDINGLDIAKILRQRNNICSIVFVTSFPEFMIESFTVKTFRFLIKPIDEEKITAVLDDYIKEKKMFSPVVVNTYVGQIVINSDEIIYIEGDVKYCNIRTINETFHSSKTLSRVFSTLPTHCFFRTHKSYVVNLYCVVLIEDNRITLSNNERVVISRSNISNFRKAYYEFIKHYRTRK